MDEDEPRLDGYPLEKIRELFGGPESCREGRHREVLHETPAAGWPRRPWTAWLTVVAGLLADLVPASRAVPRRRGDRHAPGSGANIVVALGIGSGVGDSAPCRSSCRVSVRPRS